jgi:hypothetical protein
MRCQSDLCKTGAKLTRHLYEKSWRCGTDLNDFGGKSAPGERFFVRELRAGCGKIGVCKGRRAGGAIRARRRNACGQRCVGAEMYTELSIKIDNFADNSVSHF